MNVPFVDLKAQYNSIKEEIKKEINDVLENTEFVLGRKVEDFEGKFADYCNKKYAVCVNSGTSALHLALVANGFKEGDEVITVPYTFVATVEAILYTGAKPVFVDIDESTYNIDPARIERAITKKTKAILPVHLYGQPADMDVIIEIAEKYNLKIIEDACQAHGAEYKNKKVPVTDIGCFSFYPGKNLGAYGEGGCVVTNDEKIAEKIRFLRNHGQKRRYVHQYIGYNYRMTGFQGAVLGVKLKYLDRWLEMRRKNAALYNKMLENTEVVIPKELDYIKHVYHLYVIRTDKRDDLQRYVNSKGIATGLHYPIPLNLQEPYKKIAGNKASYPAAEKNAKEVLSLPMFAELTEEQIKFIAEEIKSFFGKTDG